MKRRNAVGVFACLMMVACASVDTVTDDRGKAIRFDLTGYSAVEVEDFAVRGGVAAPEVGAGFTELLASFLRQTNAFPESGAAMDDRRGRTVRVSGVITRYRKGNPMLREWAGFGAGQSDLFMEMTFEDAASGAFLGRYRVEESSKGRKGFSHGPDEAMAIHVEDAALKITTKLVAGVMAQQ